MLARLFVFLVFSGFALAPGFAADSATADAASPSASDAEARALAAGIQLTVARNRCEVFVTWTMPAALAAKLKGVDVYRSASSRPKARTKLDYLKPSVTQFLDTAPQADAAYWYWLKVVLRDGAYVNVGPVATPAARVWSPGE